MLYKSAYTPTTTTEECRARQSRTKKIKRIYRGSIMLHREPDQREKSKPRGKPFVKGNKFGKVDDEILDTGRYERSDTREIVDKEIESSELSQDQNIEVDPKALEKIDSLDFMHGKNKLSIRFSKSHNRMFRIQIILNDQIEIRPVTYTGSSTGYSFWNLLKGALKK